MVCIVSGVLFQGWDSGTLGNTLSRCLTQDPRVARCLKRLLLSSPLTLMCVDVDVDTRVHTKSSLSVFTTLGSPLDQSSQRYK